MKRLFARLAVGAGALVLLAVVAAPAFAGGQVTISQVYGGGGNSGATITSDYVQLYNPGSTAVDLTGWTVQYASAAGTSWAATALSGTIAAGASYLVKEADGSGGTQVLADPDAIGGIAMSANNGKVALVASSTALTGSCPLASTVDFVGYGTANCFEGVSAAPGLTNTTADLRKAAGAQDTDVNGADFVAGAPAPKGGTKPGTPGTPVALTIAKIQGASQVSPFQNVKATTTGIVTAVTGDGFYLQDPVGDGNPATSEGIYVFQNAPPSVLVGDAVEVTGKVSEYTPGGSGSGNLPTTELGSTPLVIVTGSGNTLPAPAVAHPPTDVIEDDSATGNVLSSNTFDPAQDGLDYWESLEGMRVQVNDPVAVGPQNRYGELPVIGSDFGAGPRTVRGGLLLTPTDGNPERIILDDQILQTPPVANVGDTFDGPAIGVLNYNFGTFMLEITQPLQRVDNDLQREVTAAAGPFELSVATFNVENLDPGDGAAKFDGLADRIVHNLRSPKIVALEEVQDDNGAVNDGTVDSNLTLDTLVAAIEAAGGPHYSYTYVSPVNDEDGGEPGGNIRIAFLYDEAAGVSLPDGAVKGGSTEADSVVVDAGGKPHLALDPGRIDPANAAWADSRKPLAGEFLFRGRTVFVIGNHFNSKGGDDPLMGRYQPPVQSSTVQRHQQAAIVNDFVDQIVAADPSADVVVLGDLNDFQFSDTVHILEGGATPVLYDMIDTLPPDEQYSYEYEGNAQVLDHILVSKGILDRGRTFDVVHINAEFSDQLSDHDPSVLKVEIPATVDNVCAYVAEIVKPAGLANSLCVKLRHGQTAAFGHEVDAQTGKALTADQAELLKRLAAQL